MPSTQFPGNQHICKQNRARTCQLKQCAEEWENRQGSKHLSTLQQWSPGWQGEAEQREGWADEAFPQGKKILMPYRKTRSPEPGREKKDLITIFAFGTCNGHCTICWTKLHSSGNGVRCGAHTFPFVPRKEMEQESACWKRVPSSRN